MLLSPSDAELFFKLLCGLMWFVNQRLKVIETAARGPEEFSRGTVEDRVKVREAFLKAPQLLESFVNENPLQFNDEELEILSSWRDYEYGRFIIFRQLQKHAVFLTTKEPATAYGVVGLTDPIEMIAPQGLPMLTECMLLPFRGRIAYDGLLKSFNLSFGPGIRRGFNESYQRIKRTSGIVTRLDGAATTPPVAGDVETRPNKRRAKQPANPFLGRWVIESMDNWDVEAGDADAVLVIRSRHLGHLHFAAIHGEVDDRVLQRDGVTVLEFTWEGNDDGSPVSGRGRAVIDNGHLRGELYVHGGDQSLFVARPAKVRPRLSRR